MRKISNLTNIFQRGWNHQPVIVYYTQPEAYNYTPEVEAEETLPTDRNRESLRTHGSALQDQPRIVWFWTPPVYNYILAGGNSNSFSFHHYLGFHDPIWLAHIFQMGWNFPPTSIELDWCFFTGGKWIWCPAFLLLTNEGKDTTNNRQQHKTPSLKLTAKVYTWKWMVGLRSFSFGAFRPIFRGVCC